MAQQDDPNTTWDKIDKASPEDQASPLIDRDGQSMDAADSAADTTNAELFHERLPKVDGDIALDSDSEYGTSTYEAGDEAFLDRDSE